MGKDERQGWDDVCEGRYWVERATCPPPPLRLATRLAQCPCGEMVDAVDSKSTAERHAGSSPARGTNSRSPSGQVSANVNP